MATGRNHYDEELFVVTETKNVGKINVFYSLNLVDITE